MDSIAVKGGKIAFLTKGIEQSTSNDKPWIVIYPGMAMHATSYTELSEILTKQFQVLVINHRGIAPSKAPLPKLPTIKTILNDSLAVFDHLGITQCYALGESYGGMLAMGLAEYYPEKVRGIFIVSSSLAGNRSFRLAPKELASMGKNLINGASMWEAVGKAIYSKRFQTMYPDKHLAWLKECEGRAFPHQVSLIQGIAAATYHGRGLSKLQCPSYVIYGDLDEFVEPINSKKLAKKLPNSQLIEIPQAGHHLCGEAPQELANIVLEKAGFTV